MFCDNPKCRYHAIEYLGTVDDAGKIIKSETFRMLTGKTYNLCEICASAVKFTIKMEKKDYQELKELQFNNLRKFM